MSEQKKWKEFLTDGYIIFSSPVAALANEKRFKVVEYAAVESLEQKLKEAELTIARLETEKHMNALANTKDIYRGEAIVQENARLEQKLKEAEAKVQEYEAVLNMVPLALGHYEAADRHPRFATDLDMKISRFVKSARAVLEKRRK